MLWSTGDDAVPMADWDAQNLIREHAELMRVVRSDGAEVLTVPDLLSSAINAARSRGTWRTGLRPTHPTLATEADEVTAQILLGRDPQVQYRTWPDGRYGHIVDDTRAFVFTRDTAVALPKGVVLLNVGSGRRVREQTLLRFIFDNAPQLAGYLILSTRSRWGCRPKAGFPGRRRANAVLGCRKSDGPADRAATRAPAADGRTCGRNVKGRLVATH